MEEVSEDDGFVTILPHTNRRRQDGVEVSFTNQIVTVPIPPDASEPHHADWAWNGNGLLRLRLDDRGAFRCERNSAHRLRLRAAPVRRATGKMLLGRYPIERIDGNDIYIRIDTPAEGTS